MGSVGLGGLMEGCIGDSRLRSVSPTMDLADDGLEIGARSRPQKEEERDIIERRP